MLLCVDCRDACLPCQGRSHTAALVTLGLYESLKMFSGFVWVLICSGQHWLCSVGYVDKAPSLNTQKIPLWLQLVVRRNPPEIGVDLMGVGQGGNLFCWYWLKKKKKSRIYVNRGIGIYFNIKGGGGLRKEGTVDSCCDVCLVRFLLTFLLLQHKFMGYFHISLEWPEWEHL